MHEDETDDQHREAAEADLPDVRLAGIVHPHYLLRCMRATRNAAYLNSHTDNLAVTTSWRADVHQHHADDDDQHIGHHSGENLILNRRHIQREHPPWDAALVLPENVVDG
jgi:hypothetical protein